MKARARSSASRRRTARFISAATACFSAGERRRWAPHGTCSHVPMPRPRRNSRNSVDTLNRRVEADMSMSDETPGKRFSFGGFMRFSTLTLTALLLAGGAASAVVASDDLTIVTKHTHDGKPAGTSTSYLASDHVRMAREEGNETIVDLKTGVMTTLDGRKKTYFTVTKQDMEQLAAKMKERMNTPEMKKAMEAMQLSLIHISEPTRLGMISYAVFCLKK